MIKYEISRCLENLTPWNPANPVDLSIKALTTFLLARMRYNA